MGRRQGAQVDLELSVARAGYTFRVDPLEERIGARQRSASALAKARLAKLPPAVALLRGPGVH